MDTLPHRGSIRPPTVFYLSKRVESLFLKKKNFFLFTAGTRLSSRPTHFERGDIKFILLK
jgi:hypothetical protein